MPFNMFSNIMNESIKIDDERLKILSSYMRAARFADDKAFKKIVRIKEEPSEINEKELIERLNKW